MVLMGVRRSAGLWMSDGFSVDAGRGRPSVFSIRRSAVFWEQAAMSD